MSELVSTNPAQRAAVFISRFAAESGNNSSHRVRNALASMYELPAEDTSSLMSVVSDAWKYPVRIREDLEKIGLDVEPFNHIIADLERFLNMLSLDSTSSAVRNNIPGGLSASLGIISVYLNRDIPEPLLDRGKIDELMESLDKLESEIRSAGFTDNFVDNLLHRLDALKYALNHYETLGPDEVIARVDEIFGGVIRQYNQANTKSKKNVISRVMRVAGAVVLALNLFNGGFELSDNLTRFIESGIPVNAEIIENDTIKTQKASEADIA